jgi:hypothetical protein
MPAAASIVSAIAGGGATLTAQLRVEFIRPLPASHAWIEGRAEADAVDDETGLARAEIVDEADQLLGVASMRIMRTSMQKVPPETLAPQHPVGSAAQRIRLSARPGARPSARLSARLTVSPAWRAGARTPGSRYGASAPRSPLPTVTG